MAKKKFMVRSGDIGEMVEFIVLTVNQVRQSLKAKHIFVDDHVLLTLTAGSLSEYLNQPEAWLRKVRMIRRMSKEQ